jgi:hypothetical protein
MLQKQEVRKWIGFLWLRIGKVNGMLENINEIAGLTKTFKTYGNELYTIHSVQ